MPAMKIRQKLKFCTSHLGAAAVLYTVLTNPAWAVDVTGLYRGGGVDSAAQLAVLADNTFCYTLIAGSLDLRAAGRWQLAADASSFSLVEEKAKSPTLLAFAHKVPKDDATVSFRFLGQSFSRSANAVFAMSADDALPTNVRRLFAQDSGNWAWSQTYDLPAVLPTDAKYFYVGHIDRESRRQGTARLRMTQYQLGNANAVTLAFDSRQAMPLIKFEGKIQGDEVQISQFRSRRELTPELAQQVSANCVAPLLAAAGGKAPPLKRRDGSVALVPVKEFDLDIDAAQGTPWFKE